MSVVEDVRQVFQDSLAPELREIRVRLDSLENMQDVRYQSLVQRLDAVENANGVRYQAIIQRLEQIQQSFAFDKRISDLDADKQRAA